MRPHFHVVVPAWGDRYVEAATRFVIPSVKVALAECDCTASLIVYSDRSLPVLGSCEGEVRSVLPPGDNPQVNLHGMLHNLHRWTIAEAPHGSIATLLNADIVVSREFFQVAARAFEDERCRVLAGTALRTVVGDHAPPVGATASELLAWAWRNRHGIAEDCVWGRGRANFLNTVILDQYPDVVLHSVHLHPFFVRADGRRLKFKGTIDDDLLDNFTDAEIGFIDRGEVGFAELSPAQFKADQYGSGDPISVNAVAKFGRSCRWGAAHLRNFRRGIRIAGDRPVDDACIAEISDAIQRR